MSDSSYVIAPQRFGKSTPPLVTVLDIWLVHSELNVLLVVFTSVLEHQVEVISLGRWSPKRCDEYAVLLNNDEFSSDEVNAHVLPWGLTLDNMSGANRCDQLDIRLQEGLGVSPST